MNSGLRVNGLQLPHWALTLLLCASLAGCGGGGSDSASSGSMQNLTIAGTPVTSVVAGSAYVFQPTAAGPTGAVLAFSVQGLPAWASFDTVSGKLLGTPGAGDVGTYSGIVITVSDGSASMALAAFTIQVTQSASGSATVSWSVPSQNTDATSLAGSDISGFKIYYGTNASSLTQSVPVSGTGTLTQVIGNLAPGTWYFSVSVLNMAQVESPLSNAASGSVQ